MGIPVTQVNSAGGKQLLPLFPFVLANAGELPETPGLTPHPACSTYLLGLMDPFALLLPVHCGGGGYLDPWSERESQHFVFPQSSASKWAHEKE